MTKLTTINGKLRRSTSGVSYELVLTEDEDTGCCCDDLLMCETIATSGGGMLDVRNYVMPATAGTVLFSYRSYTVPDSFKVEGGGVVLINTGSVSTGNQFVTVSFFKPLGLTTVTVTVTSAEPYTAWDYSIGCPKICETTAVSGEGRLDVKNYVMPATAGTVPFSYRAKYVPYSFKVEGGGVVLINTGSVSTRPTSPTDPFIAVSFDKPLGLTVVTVTVTRTGIDSLYSAGGDWSTPATWYYDENLEFQSADAPTANQDVYILSGTMTGSGVCKDMYVDPGILWDYNIGCPESPCLCGAQVLLADLFGFGLVITTKDVRFGQTGPPLSLRLEYCVANPTAGNVMTPGFSLPGLYDPAYPNGEHSQRYAFCDTYVRYGDYRIDTLFSPGRPLTIYFSTNCNGTSLITGWTDNAGAGTATQIETITIGCLCDVTSTHSLYSAGGNWSLPATWYCDAALTLRSFAIPNTNQDVYILSGTMTGSGVCKNMYVS